MEENKIDLHGVVVCPNNILGPQNEAIVQK